MEHVAPEPPQTIALLTDFGLADPYVGQMKGVLARLAPGATVIDLCHEAAAHEPLHAGFLLASSLAHFPPGTVFLAVVDPGVGTERRILCARFPDQRLVLAPDNGLLALPLALNIALNPALNPGARLFDCTPSVRDIQDKSPVACTFHGRDIFAPLAAELAHGREPASLGPELTQADLFPARLDPIEPLDHADRMQARVLHVDRFGNLILSLLPESGPAPAAYSLVHPLPMDLSRVRTYAELPERRPGLLLGSQGFMELAMNQDSAAKRLKLALGDALTLRRTA